jgi:Flp pilus assembly pilin Flp
MKLTINLSLAAVGSFLFRIRADRGQTMAEYAILIAVIALVVVVVAITLGSSISALFSSTARKV